MKTLLVTATLFFLAVGGACAYFALSGPGHEYDLKYVIAIDPREMPQGTAVRAELPQVKGEGDPSQSQGEMRAEAADPKDVPGLDMIDLGNPADGLRRPQ
jgi:hypothetical protein